MPYRGPGSDDDAEAQWIKSVNVSIRDLYRLIGNNGGPATACNFCQSDAGCGLCRTNPGTGPAYVAWEVTPYIGECVSPTAWNGGSGDHWTNDYLAYSGTGDDEFLGVHRQSLWVDSTAGHVEADTPTIEVTYNPDADADHRLPGDPDRHVQPDAQRRARERGAARHGVGRGLHRPAELRLPERDRPGRRRRAACRRDAGLLRDDERANAQELVMPQPGLSSLTVLVASADVIDTFDNGPVFRQVLTGTRPGAWNPLTPTRPATS
jgi:hypothetical protein